MSIRQGSNYIAGGGSQVNVDNLTINKNASNEIQAVSLINQNNLNTNIKLWLGSEEDYEAVETKDENTVYFTKEGVIDIPGENSGGLEIGDIGIAPFGIDETQNKRRYLNGQVISQSQFVSFTDKIKAAIQLNPNLAATEENWQAEVTNSVLGQCGKFVIDDTLGTIRLPKVVNINGLQDLALIGNIKAESLPNITGYMSNWASNINTGDENSALYGTTDTTGRRRDSTSTATGCSGINFDASRNSSTYQNNAPVQQEAIQYPYFIQVATGTEESVDVTREIELNNPFSLLDYKWSEYEITNASWLLSNGQFNSGTTYISVYNLLLEIYNGTVTKEGVSVKSSTESYEDTDFVLNTEEQTFRLPIRTKDDYVVESHNDGSNWYRVYKSGWLEQGMKQTAEDQTLTFLKSFADTNYTVTSATFDPHSGGLPIVISKTTTTIQLGYRNEIICCGQGAEIPQSRIYFYVGETIQDANVIAASNVLTNAVMKNSSADRETVVGWGMPDYSAGVTRSSATYKETTNGFIVVDYTSSSSESSFSITIGGIDFMFAQGYGGTDYAHCSVGYIPIPKGVEYTITTLRGCRVRYFPVKGVN